MDKSKTPEALLKYISTAAVISTENNSGFSLTMEEMLADLIRTASKSVQSTFFPDTNEKRWGFLDETVQKFEELSERYACLSVYYTTGSVLSKMIKNCTYKEVVGNWFSAHEDLVNDLVKAYFSEWADCFQDKDFQNRLYDVLTSKAYINGIMIKSLGISQSEMRLVLKVMEIFLSGKYPELIKQWREMMKDEEQDSLLLKQALQNLYFDKYKEIDVFYENKLKHDVESAMNKVTDRREYESEECVKSYGESPFMMWEVYKNIEYDVGASVRNWIKAGIPAKYQLLSGTDVEVHHHEKTEHGHRTNAGCVAGTARIRMADGSRKWITQIREGDACLNGRLEISLCSDEQICNPRISAFYGINEYEPFLSLEHAVMTKRGWCCMDPDSANQINPFYKVKKLEEGDVVIRLAEGEDGKLQREEVTVESIRIRYAAEGEFFTGYDLHFREGYHSYYANDFLCLLNYPEITVSRLRRAFRGLSREEQRNLWDILSRSRGLFQKLFGGYAVDFFLEEVEKDAEL